MNTPPHRFSRTRPLVVLATFVALVAAACGRGEADAVDAEPTTVVVASAVADGQSLDPVGVTYDFPTGDAVLVSVDYQHPGDRVDNTGAYLPTNGKPTLVFVDAIW